MGEIPRSVGALVRRTTSQRVSMWDHATRCCGPLGARLLLVFGFPERIFSKNNSWLAHFQFGGYFFNYFSKTKNSRKQGTGTVASC